MRAVVRMLYHKTMDKRKKDTATAEGNGAAVQKEESKFAKIMRIKRNLSICFNFIYIIAYMAFTVFTFAGDNAEITWLPYVFGGFIVIYMVLFIVSLALAKNDGRKQNTVKDYKSGLKITKKLLKIVNLILAVALVTNAVSGDRSIFSLIISFVSALYAVYQIVSEIRRMIKRRKKLKYKEKKSECDRRFLDDVKSIWSGEEQGEEQTEVAAEVSDATAENAASDMTGVEQTADQSDNMSAETVDGTGGEESLVAVGEAESGKKKSGVASRISGIGKAASKKIDEVKKSAIEKVEEVKSAAEKAKRIGARAKEYYGERKQIEEEMSGKKKKKK